MPEPTRETIQVAVEHLARTQRGLHALRVLLDWLNDTGLGLDATNQAAVITVLQGAWGEWPGSTIDFIQECV